jgi:hypothetical protein
LATSRAIAAQGESIEDSEVLVTFDGLLDGALATDPSNARIYAMLPDVVTGAAGDAVDFLSMIELQATGPIGFEVHEYGTGRLVAYVEPYSSLIIRSFDVGGDTSIVEWKVSDTRKEIVADANQAHVADLAVTDGTTAASTMATAMGGTWAAATANSEFDTEIDAVTADYETKTDASFAEVETKVNAILAALAGGLVHETS